MENQYQCSMCKGIFEKGWSDDEAEAEAKVMFGADAFASSNLDPMTVVCDDCYNDALLIMNMEGTIPYGSGGCTSPVPTFTNE